MKRSLQGKIFLIVLLTGGFSILSSEYLAYNYDVASCMSDHLYVIALELYRYSSENDGAVPGSMADFAKYLKSRHRYQENIFLCQKTNTPYLWKTNDDKPGKSSIVIMCPPGSHGWLRRYAWAIQKKNGQFYFVKVLSDGNVTQGIAIRNESPS